MGLPDGADPDLWVLVAHEHRLVREAFATQFRANGFSVDATASSASEALLIAAERRPSIALFPDCLPDLPDQELVRRLAACSPTTCIVLLASPSRRSARQCPPPARFAAGDCGTEFLIRSTLDVWRATRNGQPREVADHLAQTVPAYPGALANLSRREREVVTLIAKGHTNARVAVCFGISVRTVEGHRAHAMRKLGAINTAGLVAALVRSNGSATEEC